MPQSSITVALSFARSAFSVAEALARGLIDHGFHVISDDHRLGNTAATWGVHKFDLIERTVDRDVTFCIVLLTPDFLSERWSTFRHCKLIEATLARKGFLLPVRIGNTAIRLRGVTDHLGEISVSDGEWEKILNYFLEKAAPVAEISNDALAGYRDVESILRLHNPRLDLVPTDQYYDGVKQIGYELYEAKDSLAKRSTFFLHLYRGINITNTSEHVLAKHARRFKADPLIILLPKEPLQTQRQRRLDNIHAAFGATATFYLDEFIWTQCTDAMFRAPQQLFDLQTFVDPIVERRTATTALAQMEDWFARDAAPVLILQGSGGIGKTTVAKAFANKLIQRGGHKVLFVAENEIIQYILHHLEVLGSFNIYHAYLADSAAGDGLAERRLDPELFRANFDNGNITIILDGLDEVVSRFVQFSINVLLESIYQHSGQQTLGKVIITCRRQFLEATELNPNVNTIELLPFTGVLAKKYFESRFPGLPNTVEKGLRIAQKMTRVSGQDAYIPFVLDVVASMLQEQIEGGFPFDDPSFSSGILDLQFDTDYIVGKVCQREVMKYKQGLSLDAQVQFFIHLAAVENSMIPVPGLGGSLTAALERARGVEEQEEQAMLNHPLLRVDETSISFRYDLLAPFFQALAVSQVLREAAPLTESVVRVLSERTDSWFALECSARFPDSFEALTFRILSLIEQVYAVYPEPMDRCRRAVSQLFLVALYRLRASGALSRETATELMKDLFYQDERIYRLALRGPKDKFVFDFSDLTFEDCFFSGYDLFWECTFDQNTYFKRCDLFLLHLPDGLNTSASRAHFDLASCRTDDTVQRVLEQRSATVRHTESIRTADLIQFLRLFYQRGHMMPQKEVVLKAKYRGQTGYGVLTTHLRDKGLIDEHVSSKSALMGPELAIVAQHRFDAIKFCTEGTMSPIIRHIIKTFKA